MMVPLKINRLEDFKLLLHEYLMHGKLAGDVSGDLIENYDATPALNTETSMFGWKPPSYSNVIANLVFNAWEQRSKVDKMAIAEACQNALTDVARLAKANNNTVAIARCDKLNAALSLRYGNTNAKFKEKGWFLGIMSELTDGVNPDSLQKQQGYMNPKGFWMGFAAGYFSRLISNTYFESESGIYPGNLHWMYYVGFSIATSLLIKTPGLSKVQATAKRTTVCGTYAGLLAAISYLGTSLNIIHNNIDGTESFVSGVVNEGCYLFLGVAIFNAAMLALSSIEAKFDTPTPDSHTSAATTPGLA